MTRILVVEDNEDLAFGLRAVFSFEGYEVDVALDGEGALEKARARTPDLLVLDLMLPGRSGFEVLTELRKGGQDFPVLVLTARSQETDVVLGFDSGADDYVVKPFSTAELLARVRALLRRARQGFPKVTAPAAGGFGEVEVCRATRTVRRSGQPVELTPKEFDLLVALLDRNGAVATRRELLKEVWGYAYADINTRTVDVHIAELRRKLEKNSSRPVHLLTVRKRGYRLQR